MSDSVDSKNDSKYCIIKAATSLFAKLGLDKCSTREIAKLSDSNISLISYYFGGKEGLYKEVMRSHALKTKEQVQEIIDDIDNVEITREVFIRDMNKIIGHLIQTRIENPELAKIFGREKLAGLPHAKEIHAEIFYPLIQKFYKLFEIGQQKGFIKKEINAAVFFITMSESIWSFFIAMECQTKATQDCREFVESPKLLQDQISAIFLTGVLT